MTSPVDICNRALSEAGARSTITDVDDGSEEGTVCALWYDVMRRRLLRAAPWAFARKTFSLSQLGSALDNTAPYPWLYKYTYPADCLRLRYILPPTPPRGDTNVVGTLSDNPYFGGPSRANRFIVANDTDAEGNNRRVVLANIQSAQAVYIRDEQNPDIFDDLFTGALEAALAAKFAIPLSGNVAMRAQFIQSASDAIIQARAADNEALPTVDHTPDWIEARGGTTQGYGNALLGDWCLPYEDINWGM